MRAQKVFCFVALVLMAASLVAVALDQGVPSRVDHRPGNCPICSWASSLSSSVVPIPVLPIESTAHSWTPQEPPPISWTGPPHRAFAARAPPPFPMENEAFLSARMLGGAR